MKRFIIALVGVVIFSAVGTFVYTRFLERRPAKPAQPTAQPEDDTVIKPPPDFVPGPIANPRKAVAPKRDPSEPGSVVFTAPELGISFEYLKNQNGQTFEASQSGTKVYVYASTAKPETGQSIEVFFTDPGPTLGEIIKLTFLGRYSPSDCLLSGTTAKLPAGFVGAEIQVPKVPGESIGSLSAKWVKCPAGYTTENGISYFVMDPKVKDKFAYVSIGQYAIMGPGKNPWQNSIKFFLN